MAQRVYRHRSPSSGCRAFYAAINKYGWNSFTTKVLGEGLTLEQANILEEASITQHNTIVPQGYNLKYGGNNKAHSMEVRQRISEAKRGVKLGPQSEAHRQKISAAVSGSRNGQFGKCRTEEEKRKISINNGRGMLGKHHTKETKRKISMKRRANKTLRNAKTYLFTSPNQIQYLVAGQFNEFCSGNGLAVRHMRKVLRSERSEYKGWSVLYVGARELV